MINNKFVQQKEVVTIENTYNSAAILGEVNTWLSSNDLPGGTYRATCIRRIDDYPSPCVEIILLDGNCSRPVEVFDDKSCSGWQEFANGFENDYGIALCFPHDYWK